MKRTQSFPSPENIKKTKLTSKLQVIDSINQLSDDVLNIIFQQLEWLVLKKATTVCTRWNDLITTNPKTMIKFKLHLGENKAKYWGVFSESFDSGRRYRDISVHSVNDILGQSVIKHFGEDLRRLKFCDLEVEEIGAFTESFAQLQKLERLEFDSCANVVECRQFKGVDGANLPKLKTLVLEQSDWTFMKLVKLSKLKTLKINLGNVKVSSTFVGHLSKLKNLEVLTLSNMVFSARGINLKQIQQLDFPLKKLALDRVTALFGNDVNLAEFMKKVGNTLEELEVTRCFKQSRVLYEAIIKHLHKLQILNIDAAPIKRSNDFFNSFGSNSSIKTLILRTYHESYDQRVLSGFVTNLLSLETLIIDGEDVRNINLRLISINLHQLKQLNFKVASGGVFENVTIPSLTTLHLTVAWPSKKADWMLICRAFPNVENLSLETLHDIDYDSICVITRAWKKSLRVVFMGKKFNSYSRKVELFFKNCERIEKLYLSMNLPGSEGKTTYTNKSFVRGAIDFNLWMAE